LLLLALFLSGSIALFSVLVFLVARPPLVDVRIIDNDGDVLAMCMARDFARGAFGTFALALKLAGIRADMDLGLPIDALRLKGAVVYPRVMPRMLERLVGVLLPRDPEALGAAHFRELHDALAGLEVSVAEDDMGMRVVGIVRPVMDCQNP